MDEDEHRVPGAGSRGVEGRRDVEIEPLEVADAGEGGLGERLLNETKLHVDGTRGAQSLRTLVDLDDVKLVIEGNFEAREKPTHG